MMIQLVVQSAMERKSYWILSLGWLVEVLVSGPCLLSKCDTCSAKELGSEIEDIDAFCIFGEISSVS